MKYRITLCLLILCYQSFCQTKIDSSSSKTKKNYKLDSVKYNFNTNEFENVPINLKEGDKVKIIVTNVNRFLYDVNVNTKNKTFESNPNFVLGGILTNLTEITKNLPSGITWSFTLLNDDFCNRLSKQFDKLSSIEQDYFQKSLISIKSKITENDLTKVERIDENVLINNFVEIKKLEDSLKKYSDKDCGKAIKAKLDEAKFQEKFQNYTTFFINIDEDLFNFISPPIEAKGDFLELDIQISPRTFENKTPFIIPLENDSIKVTIPIKSNRWKLSFSTGFFITGVKDDSKYGYKPYSIGDSLSYFKLEKENNGDSNYSLGIASKAHFMRTINKNTKAGFYLGLGLPLQKNPNLFLSSGASIGLGKREQILFNFGYIGGNVKIPSSNLNQDFKFSKRDIPIEYVDKLKIGFVCSITFNVFTIK